MVNANPGQEANSQTGENLLVDMTAQAAAHGTEKADNLAQYGLDKPQLTATVTLKGNQKQQLFVGKKAAKGANYYARGSQAPNAAFELGGYIFDNLNKKPDALK